MPLEEFHEKLVFFQELRSALLSMSVVEEAGLPTSTVKKNQSFFD